MPSGLRRRIRSTSRAKSFWPYRATRTSVSKSTSVMSLASGTRVQELDGGAAREADVLLHAAAGVEQQPEVQVDGADSAWSPRAKSVSSWRTPSSNTSKSSRSGPSPARPSCRSRSRRSWPGRRRCGTPGRRAPRRAPQASQREPPAIARPHAPILRQWHAARSIPLTVQCRQPSYTDAPVARPSGTRRVAPRSAPGRIMTEFVAMTVHAPVRQRARVLMRCLAVCHTELVVRLLAAGPAAQLRRRLPRGEPAARAAPPRRRRRHRRRRPPQDRHLPQGRRLPQHLHHRRRHRPPGPEAHRSRRCGTPARRWSTCWARRPAKAGRRPRPGARTSCGRRSPSSGSSRWPN